MIVEQHYLGCLAQASYFIADETSQVACVIDPRRDVDLYLERAEATGTRIAHVLLTHFHADFLSGHLELAERTGATIHLGSAAKPDYAFVPLGDGESLELGPQVRLEVMATPGHTPESVCYLCFEDGAEAPAAVFTGDTLFLGDVGRPDLLGAAGWTAESLASSMYDSLQRLLGLADETLVYPGHGAGSPCGKNLSSDTVSTLGKQRATNYALQPQEREAFVASLTAGQPPAPAYFPMTAGMNRTHHASLDGVLAEALEPLDLDALLAHQAAGATVLDTRFKDAFRDGHLAGSVNLGLGGNFASWCGRVLDLEEDVVLIGEPGTEREAALRMGRIGLDRVVGYLEGGASALGETVTVLQVDPSAAASQLAGDDPPLVVDVRFPGEVANQRIEGSVAIPLGDLPRRHGELPRDRRLVLQCKTGYRSMAAASVLLRAGFDRNNLLDLAGGIEAWIELGQPTVGAGCVA